MKRRLGAAALFLLAALAALFATRAGGPAPTSERTTLGATDTVPTGTSAPGLATLRRSPGTVCAHPYFPVGVGASWTYEVRASGASTEATLRVVAREPETARFTIEAERALVHAGQRSLLTTDRSVVACSDDLAEEPWSLAVAVLGPRARPHVLPAALPVGRMMASTAVHERASFERPGSLDRVDVRRRSEVREEDTVAVAAGTFRAVRVRHVDEAPPLVVPGLTTPVDATVVMDDWLAEGVGLVRRVVYVGQGTAIAAEQVLLDHVPAP